jgi:hypothetical protein
VRRIVSAQLQATGANAEVDTYVDRIVKYIPSDIVAAWIALTGLIAGAADIPAAKTLWIVFAVMVAITFIWVWRQTRTASAPPSMVQALISTGSFVVWVFALGGPFANLSWYAPAYGSIVLILYTLISAMIIPQH